MGEGTKIEWAHHTFNPWWGCTRVSPACNHCYAETFAHRLGLDVWGKNADRRFFGDKHWAEPLKWDRAAEKAGERHRVFCASMADVFEDRDDLVAERMRLFELIASTPNLDWLLLTKRPELVMAKVPTAWRTDGFPLNVWIGTTVEDQRRAYERIGWLLEIPAAVRFLSCEPMLEAIDLTQIEIVAPQPPDGPGVWLDALGGHAIGPDDMLPHRIDWVICGGESGPGARPMQPEWAQSLRDQCAIADVPFHFKQWGDYVHIDQAPPEVARDIDASVNLAGNPQTMFRVGKKAAGRLLDDRTWDGFPSVVAS